MIEENSPGEDDDYGKILSEYQQIQRKLDDIKQEENAVNKLKEKIEQENFQGRGMKIIKKV